MCNIYLFTGKYWLFQKFLIKINVPNQKSSGRFAFREVAEVIEEKEKREYGLFHILFTINYNVRSNLTTNVLGGANAIGR